MEKFRGRLRWDSKTGLFTITDLQIQDSGQYKVDDSDGVKKVTAYQLTVYNPVNRPHITSLQASSPLSVRPSANVSCWVLCSVENRRDVILSWYRGNETLNQTSSPDFSTSLSLPLEIEHRYTYYCEAKNPVSSQNLTLNISEYCLKTSGVYYTLYLFVTKMYFIPVVLTLSL
ncbi:SLAM family member 5-like [Paramormyrops kingsleyae]|uniref:SLAM family member 5-like n=1 Tax=Paramormyrops kingsleyae TaxID=1676925 RepID=UPI003B971CC8